MIIVKIMGGLGNQMFQYAAGRRLALKNNTDLKFDLSWFQSLQYPTKRVFEINCFNISYTEATKEEIEYLKGPILIPRSLPSLVLSKLKDSINAKLIKSYIRESSPGFNPEILNLNDNVYLEGYWQSELYFKEIDDIIRDDFKLNHEVDEINAAYAVKIQSSDSIAVHIRRQDYITNKMTKKMFKPLSLDYYRTALNFVQRRLQTPELFIFSDDLNWVKENLKLTNNVNYVSHNTKDNGWYDLFLMSLCKHFVIANSTFSWWGAWLSNHPEKMVCAPDSWFNNDSWNKNFVYPHNWIKISN